MKKGTWRNGKKKVTGWWRYRWAAERFDIVLDSIDPITGTSRTLCVSGDSPEWGNWKLVR
jgi:hypothetical protein